MTRRTRAAAWALAGGFLATTGCSRPTPPAASPQATAASTAPAESLPPAEVAAPSAPAWRVEPPEAQLLPGDPGLQLLAAVTSREGERRDLTARAEWAAEPEGVVAVGPGGYVRPLAPGRAVVRATVAGETAAATLTVAAPPEGGRPWDFGADVVPVLTRAGCNTGGCHGKAEGQNGFHLSLFGYDAEGDHRAIARDAGGRRVSPMRPAESLLLRKASGTTPHAGGPRLPVGSPGYLALKSWIEAGVPSTRGEPRGAVVAVRVEPAEARLDEPGPVQFRVVARHADGHERDVTRLAAYKVNDDSAASVDADGSARLLRRAETDLVVRYGSVVVSARIGTPINPDLSFDFAALPRRNVIDEELFKRLEALKVPPSPPASDAAFLRRVTLDLTGQQPTPNRVREFLKDDRPDKRQRKVDELLGSRDFVRFWQIKVGDLLAISPTRFGNGATLYDDWVYDRLRENAPWDGFVRTLLTALGNPTVRGESPANYALDGPDAQTRAEQTAQRFLGVRLRCAQCHDHPFDIWTQDDYFGLAAVFAKAGVGQAMPGAMTARPEVRLNPDASVIHMRTGEAAEPRLLDGTPVEVAADEDPRKALADWMTRPDNPYFARATANWVWAQFFGRGLADPADDLNRANPPVHPELLDALARHFVEHGYDLRDLIRTVATSEAYGLSSAPVPGNERDTRLFSRHLPRPLTAHQMADALAQATDVPNRFGNQASLGVVRRAIEISDPTTPSTILDAFGRCDRTVGCAPVANPPLSMRQMLLLIGGDVIESKVVDLNGYLSNLLELDPAPDEVAENLYLRTVCRPPTDDELAYAVGELKAAASPREGAEDLFWALLYSREFAFNH